jgi:hypothetical protein
MRISKTDYLLYKECRENAWLKVNQPDLFFKQERSDFENMIIETGNEVDILARDLFKKNASYQKELKTEKFLCYLDILVFDEKNQAYDIYEVKSSNSEDEGREKKKDNELYALDLAFQLIVAKLNNIKINNVYLVRLNRDYVLENNLDIFSLFKIENFNERVFNIVANVEQEIKEAYRYLNERQVKLKNCSCLYKSRNNHCSSFKYFNPDILDYSIYDISRIGNSPKKLQHLVDNNIFKIEDVPEDLKLSDRQRNQVDAWQTKKVEIDYNKLEEFLATIDKPINFLDYETFPCAIPKYSGYSPYQQIPFQFSLHVYNNDLKHYQFIHSQDSRPDINFLEALKEYLNLDGSIVVWNKKFEQGINQKLAKRNPEYQSFIQEVNSKIIDLEDIFSQQMYIHPQFYGRSSIKKILPVLAPAFSYQRLNIQEGGSAAQAWQRLIQLQGAEKEQIIKDLLDYCYLDTLAMYEIYKHCYNLIYK